MPAVRFDKFYRYAELTSILQAWAGEQPDRFKLASIGKSFEGRDIWLATVTNFATGSDTDKPAFFIEANIHAVEVTGCTAALHLIDKLLTQYGIDEKVTRVMDTRAFFRKWLKELMLEQLPDGMVGNFVPNPYRLADNWMKILDGSAGWGDVAARMPWSLYWAYGDIQLLERQYESMKAYVEYERKRARQLTLRRALNPRYWLDGSYRARKKLMWETGYQWGEWLEPNEGSNLEIGIDMLRRKMFARSVVATAYFASSARIVTVSSRLHLPGSRGRPVDFDFDDPQLVRGYHPDRAYKNSKLAVLWFTYELQRRLAGRKITANAVCPGFVPTTATIRSTGRSAHAARASR